MMLSCTSEVPPSIVLPRDRSHSFVASSSAASRSRVSATPGSSSTGCSIIALPAFNVEARYTLGLSAGVSAGEIEASSNSFSILMSFLFPGSSRGYGTPDAPNPNR